MNSILLALFFTFPIFAMEPQSSEILPVSELIPVESPPLEEQTETESKKKETESHWGLALGGGFLADYPGADQGRFRYLLMPAYRGKSFTIDRQDGIKGELVNESIVKLSFSFIFLFPTKSEDVPIRRGMPDLDWTFQLGPEVQIFISRTFNHSLFMRIPLRFIASTDFSHDFIYRDWNLAPGLRSIFYLDGGWGEITTRFDMDLASERYNDMFHQVDPQYATADRPAYNARAGFLEYIVGVNYSYYDAFPWIFFGGVNGYFTNNSINRDSPLILKTSNYSFFGGIIRYF